MMENSFLEEIKKKKNCLKSQNTVVTSVDGEKYVEKIKENGKVEITKLNESSFGFVVDEKPDLEIAQILPFLLLSSQDVVQDCDLLERNGVTHVLSIGIDIPFNSHLSDIVYKKVDLPDLPEADLLTIIEECFHFIDTAKQNNSSKVLVHCNAGYSRSPSIVIAYLMKSFCFSLEKALQMVKEKRNIRPNDGFMKQLKSFENKLQRQ